MKNKWILSGIALSLILLTACGAKRPEGVLSEDEMVDLIVDMELTEAYLNTQSSSSSQMKLELGQRVLKAHGVSQESLDTTLAWYGRNIDEYSELFANVDKEILKRQKKYTEVPGEKEKVADNLWIYNEHLVFSNLSDDDSFVFSFPVQGLEKGQILNFSFSLPNSSPMKNTIGVEYNDGTGESSVNNSNGKNKIEITLQTDTSKKVSRVFGVLELKDIHAKPFYIDSISLTVVPIDSAGYRSMRRAQKHFGIMVPQKMPEKVAEEKTDSLTSMQNSDANKTVDATSPQPQLNGNKPISNSENKGIPKKNSEVNSAVKPKEFENMVKNR